MTDLTAALRRMTPAQAEVIRIALDQFVENGQEYVEGQEGADPEFEAQLEAATAALDDLNEELITQNS